MASTMVGIVPCCADIGRLVASVINMCGCMGVGYDKPEERISQRTGEKDVGGGGSLT